MMRNLNLVKASTDHEELFVARYERLLTWSLHLTGNNRDLAEDLLHDAFIQFTLGHRDLDTIQDLDSYLYGILRHLHLSQVRRATRSRLQQLTIIEYDSAQAGLRTIDPSEHIHAQDELRRICHYVCARKETSKAGSVLMLRFFHGYYPGEIALITRISRTVVEVRLGHARSEAKLSLENPKALSFMGANPFVEVFPTGFARTPDDFLIELRQMIFNSRRSPCPKRKQLQELYREDAPTGLNTSTLGHIVSCARCLDEVNRLVGLPPLSERYPMNTLGKDPGKKGGPGEGGGAAGGGPGVGDLLSRFRRRARDTFEHRPKELHISVNGFIQGSQKINSEMSELTLDIVMPEAISFVEVFSEQDVRLLLLDVDGPLPPRGPVEQRVETEFSAGRTLALSLKFTNPWPTLKAVYQDPLVRAESLLKDDAAKLPAEEERVVETAEAQSLKNQGGTVKSKLRRLFDPSFILNPFWSRPASATALLALVLVAAFALLYWRVPAPSISAAELLTQASAAEDAVAARTDQVVHRTINLEEKSASGALITRRRIEVWQSGEKGITARRLYDERGQLVAGDWRRSDGVQTLYHHRRSPKLQIPNPQSAVRNFEDVWQIDTSAKEFAQLIGNPASAQVEENGSSYSIHSESAGFVSTGSGSDRVPVSLLKATLVLSRADLHATEQRIVVRQGDEVREYVFKEATFERHSPSTVAPAVFEPEPELLSETKLETPNSKLETGTSSLPVGPFPVMATAALEVEVIDLLNTVGGFMGEQISVQRTPAGQIQVNALVETDKRKIDLINALAPVRGNSAVRIKIETVAEAEARQKQQAKAATRSQPGTVERFDAVEGTNPVYAELRKRFSDEEARRFVSRVLNRSGQARSHALAMKQLSGRFSQADLASLTSAERGRWLALVRGHAERFVSEAETLRRDLQQFFPEAAAGAGGGGVIDSDTQLQARARELYDASVAIDRSLNRSLALTAGVSGGAPLGPAFWGQFAQAVRLARSLASAK